MGIKQRFCCLALLPLLSFAEVGLAVDQGHVLEAEGMTVVGSRETPKGIVLVPWRVAPPDQDFEPLTFSVAEEVFEPLDRNVFQRQIRYYKQLFQTPEQAFE